MDWSLLLAYQHYFRPCVYVVLNNGWIQPKNFSVELGKDVEEFLEERFVGRYLFRGVGCPLHDILTNIRFG